MKVHAGVDAATGYIHTITGTSANIHDVTETARLIRKNDHAVYADSGYLGVSERDEIKNDETLSKIVFRTNRHPSSLKISDNLKGISWEKKIEHEMIQIVCLFVI